MPPIEFSTFPHIPVSLDYLKRVIAGFSGAPGLTINLTEIPWDAAWKELVQIGLHQCGADISEIGTTWISSLAAMDALRPFTPAEVGHLGGVDAFLPAAWQSNQLAGHPAVWAIPWMADVRVIAYRRDLFEQAGVDPAEAFRNAPAMCETFERLQAGGIATPWAAISTHHNTLYHILSWIWGAGGDILSLDGKAPLFHKEPALSGIRAYFDLYRFMPRSGTRNGEILSNAIEPLLDGRIAVTMIGPWQLWAIRQHCAANPQAGISLALPPGPSFVGGSSFIVWRHIPKPFLPVVVELIHYLLSPQVLADYCQAISYMPVRLDVLSQPPFSTDPFCRVFAEALKGGRSHPSVLRWGMIEDRLTATFNDISMDVYAHPDQNLDAALARHLEPVVRRLGTILRD